MAFSNSNIRPIAILAGLGAAGAIVYFAHKKHKQCTVFPDVYSKDGPIHLNPEADEMVREFIAIKLKDAETAGIDVSEEDLSQQAFEYITECDDSEKQTVEAQQIASSIGSIVHYMKTQKAVEG